MAGYEKHIRIAENNIKNRTKILLILCGGTICTAVQNIGGQRVRAISEEAGSVIVKNYLASDPEFSDRVMIEESHNFGFLSENMTVEKWNQIIEYLKGRKDLDEFDGIIFAHGTDTLAYSAVLFSLVLKTLNKPVFLVSSNAPLSEKLPIKDEKYKVTCCKEKQSLCTEKSTNDDEEHGLTCDENPGELIGSANGDENFKAAVELICCGIAPGVYVTYKNTNDNKMYLHQGSRLLQCRNYDENFYSRGAIELTDTITAAEVARISAFLPQKTDTVYDEEISLYGDWVLADCILKIEPYVGLDYDAFNYDKYKAVLHGTYHSGTVCENMEEYLAGGSSHSILSLIDRPNRNFDVYISPSDFEGDIYDTIRKVKEFSNNRPENGMNNRTENRPENGMNNRTENRSGNGMNNWTENRSENELNDQTSMYLKNKTENQTDDQSSTLQNDSLNKYIKNQPDLKSGNQQNARNSVEFLCGMTNEMAYVKLMVAYSAFMPGEIIDPEKTSAIEGNTNENGIIDFMRTDIAGELGKH